MVCKIGFTNWNAKIALLRASMVVTYYIKQTKRYSSPSSRRNNDEFEKLIVELRAHMNNVREHTNAVAEVDARANMSGWISKTRVMSSNPRITSSNLRVTSSNSRVTSSNPRVRLKARVARLKARVTRLKAVK